MKLFTRPVLVTALLAGAFLSGCATAPDAPAAKAAVAAPPKVAATPAAVTPTPPPAPAEAEAALPPPPPLSTEAAEIVARFTQTAGGDALPHEMADTTSFPEAMASLQVGAKAPKFEFTDAYKTQPPPEGLTADGNSTALVVRDWTGLVLVPISTALSKAYTSSVRLLKVEAHPLNDGRVRIWIRVQNVARQDFSSEIACAFRMRGEGVVASPYFYELQVPARNYRDVFFVSPEGQLSTYTVLVRPVR